MAVVATKRLIIIIIIIITNRRPHHHRHHHQHQPMLNFVVAMQHLLARIHGLRFSGLAWRVSCCEHCVTQICEKPSIFIAMPHLECLHIDSGSVRYWGSTGRLQPHLVAMTSGV
eukprot:5286306-Amphidinium_carterae.1